jgi:hypothetical protein
MKILAVPGAREMFDDRFVDGALADPPRIEARFHRGRWLLLSWYRHADGVEAVRAVTTLALDGDRVARLENYFYNPDLLLDIGGELDVPVRVNGHRWCKPELQQVRS